MRFAPQSLAGRLLAGGALAIAAAVIVAALLIGAILQRFIIGQIDQRLDATISDVGAHLVQQPDGAIALSARGESPDFQRLHSGWYWQVKGGNSTITSASLEGDEIEVETPHFDWRQIVLTGSAPTLARDRHGEMLHARTRSYSVNGAAVLVTATAPGRAVTGPLTEALTAMGLSLLALGALLLLGLWLQVRIGLKPVRGLQQAVHEVAEGRASEVPDRAPAELRPLAQELNALIRQNAERLEAARLHSANLAHSLKTPLATLSLALSAKDADHGLLALTERMEQGIRHHLGRARMAAMPQTRHLPLMIAPRLADLAQTLRHINASRTVSCSVQCPDDLSVPCDARDFDEMAGNLLDNAFKWAGSAVRISARRDENSAVLAIEDDGPGLSDSEIIEALQPGRRLDEKVPGHGFGLSIVAELAALYGGTLALMRSAALGGLNAELRLPLRA
ncbi:sensor histidine kinase [Aestuariivirga sp.]|uniref:sensor histidine kinase n=1 Tax=Aestuariivirga sp. TaxID=2650926 RepID=UPI0039E39AF2